MAGPRWRTEAAYANVHMQAETHKNSGVMRGYIAMLVVEKPFRGAGTGESTCHASNPNPPDLQTELQPCRRGIVAGSADPFRAAG